MPENVFTNKPRHPTDAELANALGPSKATWDQLLAELDADFGVNVHEWKSYSPKAGWSLRVKRNGRTIVWLGPCQRCFNVVFVLGEKAMCAARQITFSKRIVKVLNEAPKWPEGTGVRLEAKSSRDIPVLKNLARIKLAN